MDSPVRRMVLGANKILVMKRQPGHVSYRISRLIPVPLPGLRDWNDRIAGQ